MQNIPLLFLELKPSGIEGVGVFAVRDIQKGQKISDGIHEEDYADLVTWEKVKGCDVEVYKKILAFCVGTPKGFIPPENLDFNTLSIDWYMNHSCDGNIGFDEHGNFITRRDIKKGEELTYDYGLAESNPGFRMDCTCKAINCRKTITGNDWKNTKFGQENFSYMLPTLRKAHLDP